MSSNDNQLIKEFLIESFESLEEINGELTNLEKNPDDKDVFNSIYRKVHTLKGSANFLGYKELQKVTHVAESLLDTLREGLVSVDSMRIDLLLKVFDFCQIDLKSIESVGSEVLGAADDLCIELERALQQKEVNAKIQNTFVPDMSAADVKMEGAKIEKEDKAEKSQDVAEQTEAVTAPEPTPKVSSTKNKVTNDQNIERTATTKQVSDSVVRVNVKLLDKIMNVVGELVLNRNQILQCANKIDSSELNRLAGDLNVITTELQTDIMTTRMQPVGSVLGKFERVVRDLAKQQSKNINLTIYGKETELDKTLLDAIRDPLTHLIRNSVDHGIESSDQRASVGKSEEGNIVIRSYHEGGQVTIEIQDDGKGIDPQVISKKAIEKGLITKENAKSMSEKELVSLIFAPGFSTAEKVTNISGRGVGMDVVRSNIEKIGGSVDLESRLGHGSTFKLKIPLTLAIVPALVICSSGNTFAIPQVNLVELVRLEDQEIQERVEQIHNKEFFRLRGDLIPIFRLNDSLRLTRVSEEELAASDMNIVILNAESKVYGLVVDEVLDTQEIVVKPLSRNLKGINAYAGATIMGDGKVALIVDPLGFLNLVEPSKNRRGQVETGNDESRIVQVRDSQELLLVELGDQRKYGIPLVLVNRLEEFSFERIEWSGDRALVRYRETVMPLVNIEKVLELKAKSIIEADEKTQNFSCVVVRSAGRFFGFVVNEIHDIAESDGEIDHGASDRDGLLGTAFVSEATVPIINIHHILDELVGTTKSSSNTLKRKNVRILYAEDSPLYRRVVNDYLCSEGYEVTLAEDGQAAIDILANEKFDLILTDVEMPRVTGFELAKWIREQEGLRQLPVVGLTTKVSVSDREIGLESGFTEHLEKLKKDELISYISNLLEGHQERVSYGA